MNKTKSVNRLYLALVLWVFLAGRILNLLNLPLNAWENMAAGEILLVLPALVFLMIKREPVGNRAGKGRIRLSMILMTLLFTVLSMPLIIFLNAFSMLFSTNYVAEESTMLAQGGIGLNLLTVAFIPAVCEEIMFRGALYQGYREQGILKGAVVCGLLFGLMHRNVNQFFYASAMGILFCLLVEATGSIFYSMEAHFLINGWNVLIMAVQEPLTRYLRNAQGAAYTESAYTLTRTELVNGICIYGVMAAAATALAVCVLVWMAEKNGRLQTVRENLHAEQKGLGGLVTPALCLGAGICLGYMIVQEIPF